MLKLSQRIDALTETFGKASAVCVLLTVATGFYNVVARYLGRFLEVKLTSNMFIELQWYFFSLTFLFGFAYVLKNGANVRVDFLYSKWNAKTKAIVDLIGHAIFLLTFCFIGLYVTTYPVLQSWGLLPDGSFSVWELSPDPDGLPRAPIKSMILVGFTLLALQTVSEIIKNAAVILGKAEFYLMFNMLLDRRDDRPQTAALLRSSFELFVLFQQAQHIAKK